MSDDREFDRMLEEEVSGMPPPDEAVREVTPWRRAMGRVVRGIGLTTVTLNFWYLDYLLPAAGAAQLVLGLRALRRENRWLAACWGLSLGNLALFFLDCVWDATILPDLPDALGWTAVLTRLALSFCLWRGIRAVRRAAGQPPKAGAAGALLLFQAAGYALAILAGGEIRLGGLLLVLPVLAVYACILRCLARLPALLDGAGYVVRAAPARLSDRTVCALWTAALAAGVLLAGTLLCRYPMEWALVEAGEQAGLEEIRASLLALGMPEQVLDDLAPGDLAGLEGALSVTVQVSEKPFRDGRLEERTDPDGVIRYQTVYDEKELRLSDIAVELPGGRWQIIHHFLWQADPGLRTTECIKLWPITEERLGGWRSEGVFTGRLLYDWEGRTYAGDYYSIETEHYTSDTVFWGETQSSDLFAVFSLPREGDRCRGYLTYGAELVDEGWLLSSWSNYTHQVKWLNYPAMTAQAFDMSGIWGGFGAFDTAQSAIQFYPGRD